MYGTSGVIEMPPPPASRQDSPAIQRRGARNRSLGQGPGSSGGPRAQLLDEWMAGLAGGGGISIYYAILCIEYV